MYRATLFGSSEEESQSSEVCDNESICFNITDLRNKGISWHFCSTPFMSPPPFFFVLNVTWCLFPCIVTATACFLYFNSIAEYQGGGGKEKRDFSMAIKNTLGIPLGKINFTYSGFISLFFSQDF